MKLNSVWQVSLLLFEDFFSVFVGSSLITSGMSSFGDIRLLGDPYKGLLNRPRVILLALSASLGLLGGWLTMAEQEKVRRNHKRLGLARPVVVMLGDFLEGLGDNK